MRITIQAVPDAGMPLPDPSEFDLAAGGLESPDGLTINGERNTQPFFGLRSAAAKYRDRQNARVTISFRITRLHATIAAAQEYMLLHQANIPGGGTVTFTCEDDTEFEVPNAVVTTISQHHTGRTTFHNYQITGGQIVQS